MPALTEHRAWRLTLFTLLYFAQGLPIAVFVIALPAQMAQQGVSAGDIAGFIAWVSLPWGLKWALGPVMDRWQFRPMGKRRPWALFAQGMSAMAFLLLALIDDPATQIRALTVVGVIVSAFSALQDVGTDGMAVDILPEQERGRANALMAAGQVAGYSSFAALTSYALNHWTMQTTALMCATPIVLVFVLLLWITERPGERRLPWSVGDDLTDRSDRVTPTFVQIATRLWSAMLGPASLLLIAAETLNRMRDGIALALLPVVAVQDFGYTATEWTTFSSIAQGIAAGVGIAFGWVIDRWGAPRLFAVGMAISTALSLLIAATNLLGGNGEAAMGAYVAMSLVTQIGFVAFIAAAMGICSPAAAATQFAVYMSLANLARSLGGYLYQWAGDVSRTDSFLIMAALTAIAAVALIVLVRIQTTAARTPPAAPDLLPP